MTLRHARLVKHSVAALLVDVRCHTLEVAAPLLQAFASRAPMGVVRLMAGVFAANVSNRTTGAGAVVAMGVGWSHGLTQQRLRCVAVVVVLEGFGRAW